MTIIMLHKMLYLLTDVLLMMFKNGKSNMQNECFIIEVKIRISYTFKRYSHKQSLTQGNI